MSVRWVSLKNQIWLVSNGDFWIYYYLPCNVSFCCCLFFFKNDIWENCFMHDDKYVFPNVCVCVNGTEITQIWLMTYKLIYTTRHIKCFCLKSPHYWKSHHSFKTSGNKSKTVFTTADGLHTSLGFWLMAFMGRNCFMMYALV